MITVTLPEWFAWVLLVLAVLVMLNQVLGIVKSYLIWRLGVETKMKETLEKARKMRKNNSCHSMHRPAPTYQNGEYNDSSTTRGKIR